MSCKSCKFPSISQQVTNFSLSLFNVITQAIKTGQVRASEEVVQDRIDTCSGCEFLKDNRCSECGCFIALKAGLKSESCPRHLW